MLAYASLLFKETPETPVMILQFINSWKLHLKLYAVNKNQF